VFEYERPNDDFPRLLEGRAQLSDEVASFTRELIMSGQLTGGEVIRLDRLAKYLGVSATPVREALMSLRAEGFVELEPRRGFYVVPLTEEDVRDLFHAQATLAGELAGRAAKSIDDGALLKLREIQSVLVQSAVLDDAEEIERQNHLFHREINLAALSPKLTWLLGALLRYSPRRFYRDIEGWSNASIDDHEDILVALEEHDSLRASEAMAEHIIHAGSLLAEFLKVKNNASELNGRLGLTAEVKHK